MTRGDEAGRGFAMVPAWLVWKRPSANALIVYVHLALHGTFNPGTATYEECRPSKKTLAQGDPSKGYPGTGLGIQVVGRALRELEDLGAIRGETKFDPKTGAQAPTVYRVQFGHVIEAPPPRIASDTPPEGTPKTAGQPPISDVIPGAGITSDTGGVSPPVPAPGITSDTQPITLNQEPLTQTPPTPRTPAAGTAGVPAEGGGESPPEPRKPAEEILGEVLNDVPPSRRPRGLAHTSLVDSIAEHLAAGWGRQPLREALEGSFAGVGNIGAVLRSRIAGLGAPPPSQRETPPANQKPEWCQTCDERTRIRDADADGTDGKNPHRCPECHPLTAWRRRNEAAA